MIVLFLFNEILVLTNCKCGNYYRGIYLVTSSKDKKKWNCIKISLESRYKYEELLDPNGKRPPLFHRAVDPCMRPMCGTHTHYEEARNPPSGANNFLYEYTVETLFIDLLSYAMPYIISSADQT